MVGFNYRRGPVKRQKLRVSTTICTNLAPGKLQSACSIGQWAMKEHQHPNTAPRKHAKLTTTANHVKQDLMMLRVGTEALANPGHRTPAPKTLPSHWIHTLRLGVKARHENMRRTNALLLNTCMVDTNVLTCQYTSSFAKTPPLGCSPNLTRFCGPYFFSVMMWSAMPARR